MSASNFVFQLEHKLSHPNFARARAYRNYMKKMVNLGLVKVLGIEKWREYEIIF